MDNGDLWQENLRIKKPKGAELFDKEEILSLLNYCCHMNVNMVFNYLNAEGLIKEKAKISACCKHQRYLRK